MVLKVWVQDLECRVWGWGVWCFGFGACSTVPSAFLILAFQRIHERPHLRERSTSVLAKEAGWKEVAKESCDTVGAEHSA